MLFICLYTYDIYTYDALGGKDHPRAAVWRKGLCPGHSQSTHVQLPLENTVLESRVPLLAPCPVLEGLFLVSQYRSASAVWENTSVLPPLQGKVQLRSLGSPAEESLGKAEVLLNILLPKPGWERPPKIPPSLRWTMDLRFLPLAEGRCLWQPFSVFRH